MTAKSNLPKMKQLEERQVEAEVKIMVWSPKMDILALALSGGEVSLYRLNWQKIWTIPPPVEGFGCSTLCWRPDGKVLMAAYDSGQMVIMAVDGGERMHTIEVATKVNSLAWILCPEQNEDVLKKTYSCGDFDENSEKEETWSHMTKLPLLSKAFTSAPDKGEQVAECQKLNDGSENTLLIAGSDDGMVSVYMDGYLLCSQLNISSLMRTKCSIRHVSLASNMSTFSVIFSKDKKRNQETLHVVVLSMPLVAACFQELVNISKSYSILQGTLSYLDDTLEQISEAWEGIVVEFDSHLETYSINQPHGGVSADLLELLMFGVPNPNLLSCFLHMVTEKGLKKTMSSVESSYSNIQKLLLKYLQADLQSINFFLSDLSGLARASEKFDLLGLTDAKIGQAQRAAARFWCKGVELQQVIDDSRKGLKIFFQWLHWEILKINDDPIPEHISKFSQQDFTFIADFLESFDNGSDEQDSDDLITTNPIPDSERRYTHTHVERVGQYLRHEELDQPIDRSKNPWYNFLEENPELKNLDLIVEVNENSSLVQEYLVLCEAVNEIYSSMLIDMTPKCNFLGELQVTTPNPSEKMFCRQIECESESSMILGAIGFGIDNFEHGQVDDVEACHRVFFYSVDHKANDRCNLVSLWLNFRAEGGNSLSLIDTEFYTSNTLSIYLSHNPMTDNQIIVQVPVEIIQQHLNQVLFTPFKTCKVTPDKIEEIICTKSIFEILDQSHTREVENISGCQYAVSGPRKVAAFLFKNKKRIRIYDMEVEEDDEEEDETMAVSNISSELNTSA